MIIYVKIIWKKKCFLSDRQTDRQTDTRSTQNYSSEPHKIPFPSNNQNIDKAAFKKILKKKILIHSYVFLENLLTVLRL